MQNYSIEITSYVENILNTNYQITYSAQNPTFDSKTQTLQKILKLITLTFNTLNIKSKDSFKNTIKDYFDLAIDSRSDDELFQNIVSLIIVFAFALINSTEKLNIKGLQALRDNFIIGSEPWERLNTLSFFLVNEQEITSTFSKETLSIHEQKLILHRLINDAFKDKPHIVNKFSDILFLMAVNARKI